MASLTARKAKLVKKYFKLQEEYEKKYGKDTVILYECGSFMEIFGISENKNNIPIIGQMDRISEITGITKTKTNKKLPISLANPNMIGFPSHQHILEKYCSKLLEHQFTVVIIRQTEKNSSGSMKREVSSILSPSINLINDNNILTNYLVCIYIENKCSVVCSIDLSIGKNECYITQDENSVNKIIYSLNPREIVIYDENKDEKEEIIEKYSLQKYKVHFYNEIDKKIFNINFQNLYLQTIFNEKEKNMLSTIENLSLEKYPLTIVCYILMLKFVNEHDSKIIQKIHKPKIINFDSFLELSSNTISQLHLIDNQNKSVFDIINKTSTILGKRLLKERLLNPLTNIKKINKRYDEIEKLLKDSIYKDVEKLLKKIKDLD